MTQTLERMRRAVGGLLAGPRPQKEGAGLQEALEDCLRQPLARPEEGRAARLLAAPRRWLQMMAGPPAWSDSPSLNLAGAIAGEVARLATVELEARVQGGPRAAYLDRQLQPVLAALRTQCEYAAGCGGVMMKPCVEGKRIAVDFALPGQFLPTAWDGRGNITGAVFVEQRTLGRACYTRLEHHRSTPEGYVVENRAFRAAAPGVLGRPVPLAEVPLWAGLTPRVVLTGPGGQGPAVPLFSYFKMPFANAADPGSPLGASVFARAEGLLAEADRQYGRLLWEYEGSELAVDASVGAVQAADGRYTMPRGRRRLFRELAVTGADGGDLYRVFSPAIRDESLLRGLDSLLKRIEFACCLSYGTLSDPQSVARTAEEIRMSKQRSFAAVCDIQKALRTALEQLVAAMDACATLYGLAPAGEYQLALCFGDGITTDTATERSQMRLDCQAGAACWWEYRMKFYGECEAQARARAAEAREEQGR